MLHRFGRWLADVPLGDPVEQRVAPLFQLLLFGLIAAILVSMGVDILLDGIAEFIWGAFRFSGTLLLSVIGSLLLLRRGYFKAAQWLVIAGLMVVITDILRVVNLSENGHLLLLFVLPITTAGLLVGRGALALTVVISIGVVIIAALMPTPPLTSMIVAFILVTGVLAFLLDIVRTGLRRALISSIEHAAALEASEERFRAMADTAPAMLWMSDTTKASIYFNKPWLDFTGRTFEQEYGYGWVDNIHPDDSERCLQTYYTAFDQRREFTIDYRMRRHDGEYRWVVDNGVPRYDSSSAFLGYIGSCIDITDRKLSEERTQLLQQLTAALSESLTIQRVADTIMGEVMESINSHVGTIYRFTEDRQHVELMNRHGLPPETIKRYHVLPISASGPMMEALREATPVWVENRDDYAARFPEFQSIVAQNGSHAIACLPLIVDARPIGALTFSFRQSMRFDPPMRAFMIALAQQCTQALERARLYEIEAEARRRAEEANQLKLSFLAMVSHELRTPLTSIKGFTSSLLAPDVSWSKQEQHEFYRIMDEEADKLTDLVEQLLDVSRLHAGALRIDPEATTVGGILDTAKPELEALTGAHELVLNVPPDLPPVLADQQRIAQVIANLVNNAVKFSPPASRIELRVETAGDSLRFTVADEGEGIPLHERERIFEAFRQAERKTLQPGAGLGLAICKGLVEAHGGRIWIEDPGGPGTRISFTLPTATNR